MVLLGDCLTVLSTLPEQSVQCVVTSPPYWGLRDYGVPEQLGLEPSPCLYVERMIEVFTEVHRVLRTDGTLWLNLGDSYANDGKWGGETGGLQAYLDDNNRKRVGREKRFTGLKPKDLVGVPWRVAFALQAAGWYLRSDIIWSKPNPMPESVQDRPTKAHEYIFLLTKSERYYYNADAIREPFAESTLLEIKQEYRGEGVKDYEAAGVQNPSDVKRRIINKLRSRNTRDGVDTRGGNQANGSMPTIGSTLGRNKRTVWTVPTAPFPGAHFATFPEALIEPCILAGSRQGDIVLDPFAGSGTVGVVCVKAQRRFIGIELNPEYVALAERRIGNIAPLFAEAAQ